MLDVREILNNLLEAQVHGGSGVNVGTITEYAGIFPPDGWVICDGRALSRSMYEELFDAIGTTYGSGDGSTTFNIPDFRGRTAIGVNSSYALGTSGGASTVTLDVNQIPSHNHTVYQYVGPAVNDSTNLDDCPGSNSRNLSTEVVFGRVSNTGGGQAHNNMQPYLTVNYIIFTGVYQTIAAQTTWTLLEDRISNSQLNIPVVTNFGDVINANNNVNITGTLTVPTVVGNLTGTATNATNATYVNYKEQWVDLSSLNQSTYYPVTGDTLPYDGYHMIKVSVHLNSNTVPSWSTHGSGFTVNLLLYTTAAGWGTTASETIVLDDYYGFSSVKPVSYTQNSYSSTPVLWMRGGGKYRVFTDYNCTWTVRTSTYYTYNSGSYTQTVAPQSSLPDINCNGVIRAGNFYGVFNSTSDERIKKDITNLKNTDNFLLSLSPKSFKYKNDPNEKINYGFIAQDVANLIEEYNLDNNTQLLTKPDGNEGNLYLCYQEFIPMLTHLCQSQQKQIEFLQQEVQNLKEIINEGVSI